MEVREREKRAREMWMCSAALAARWGGWGWGEGVLGAELTGPWLAKMLGVRGRPLAVAGDAVDPPRSATGMPVMSMDLLLSSDDEPLHWRAPSPTEGHPSRGARGARSRAVVPGGSRRGGPPDRVPHL